MRKPCCDKKDTTKGAWSKQEDQRLIDYIKTHGEGCWRSLPKAAGFSPSQTFFFLLLLLLSVSPSSYMVSCGLTTCRVASLWQKLQAEMDKLSKTRPQTR